MDIIRFSSVSDFASYSSDGAVPTAEETDAIVAKELDVDASSAVSVGGNTQASLYIDFTKGSLTNCVIKFYASPVGNPSTEWYAETEESSASGTLTLNPINITLTASGKSVWHFPLGSMRAYRITVQGTGSATNSSIGLTLGLRSN